jgi:hypothetical protein
MTKIGIFLFSLMLLAVGIAPLRAETKVAPDAVNADEPASLEDLMAIVPPKETLGPEKSTPEKPNPAIKESATNPDKPAPAQKSPPSTPIDDKVPVFAAPAAVPENPEAVLSLQQPAEREQSIVSANPADPKLQFLPLPEIATNSNAAPLVLPLYASRSLAVAAGSIRRVLLVMHDADRDAAALYQKTVLLAGREAAGDKAETLVLAPLFPAQAEQQRLKASLGEGAGRLALWDAELWWQGEPNVNGNRRNGVSSMAALDLLLMILADKARYPALDTITLAGVGRGADFLQRYAVLGKAPAILSQQKLNLRFVLAAPRSLAFLSSLRAGEKSGSFFAPEAAACPEGNRYPYGLDKLNPYGATRAANQLRQDFLERELIYLVGTDNAAAEAGSCAEILQGKGRRQRTRNFFDLLQSLAGAELRQKLFSVRASENDGLAILSSSCGTALLFGAQGCEPN